MSKNEKKPIKFTLNGKEVDLTDHVPLTIGDVLKLKKNGLDMMKIQQEDLKVEQVIELIQFVCRKADATITSEDVETMPVTWMQRLASILYTEEEDHLPF